jgi:hypothetical protein
MTIDQLTRKPIPLPYLGPSTNNPAGNWSFHEVVVKDGMVYDSFTGPDGLSPADFEAQFLYYDAIDFGF